jgi:hypothetical protein
MTLDRVNEKIAGFHQLRSLRYLKIDKNQIFEQFYVNDFDNKTPCF